MSAKTAPVIANPAGRDRESFANPEHGNLTWFTLFSGDITPTAEMSAGITEVPPNGGFLKAHRHAQAEIYFVHEGVGVLTIDDLLKGRSEQAHREQDRERVLRLRWPFSSSAARNLPTTQEMAEVTENVEDF